MQTVNKNIFPSKRTYAKAYNNSRHKGNPFELGYLEGDISGSGGEIAAIVSAAVALALLIALISGCLSQLFCLDLQKLVEGFLYAAAHKFLELPLDNFFVSLYNLLAYGLLSPFRMMSRNFILPEICKPYLFLFLFNLQNLLYFESRSYLYIDQFHQKMAKCLS